MYKIRTMIENDREYDAQKVAIKLLQTARAKVGMCSARGNLLTNALDHVLNLWPNASNVELLRQHVHRSDNWIPAFDTYVDRRRSTIEKGETT